MLNWPRNIVTEPKKEEMEEKLLDLILSLLWGLTELLRQTLKRTFAAFFFNTRVTFFKNWILLKTHYLLSRTMDAAERRKKMIQESKFLGGDMEHTVI